MLRLGVRCVGRFRALPSTCRLSAISCATALGPVLFGDFAGITQPSDGLADTASAHGLSLPAAALRDEGNLARLSRFPRQGCLCLPGVSSALAFPDDGGLPSMR